ncbi:uncharacterized protein LOC142167092 [Nicotiana tabacum]|uniref:Uncharacterized protein LOC142167092 n=1 Tax=Nicotiana tabacum TaxID=4097 RepID=A0AC58SEF9_TOBAC
MIFRHVFSNWYSLLVNGNRQGFFKSERGLREGDHIPPSLFVLCVEFLSRKLHDVSIHREFTGFYMNKKGPIINHLAYVDDVILFSIGCKKSLDMLMKALSVYEKVSDSFGEVQMRREHFTGLPGIVYASHTVREELISENYKIHRSHPLIKKWYSGLSNSWNAMCNIKSKVDMHILWKVGKRDIAFWFDNWTNLGPLCNFLPEGSKPVNIKLSEVLVNDQWWWGGWDSLMPEYIMETIDSMKLKLRPAEPCVSVWTVDEKGTFSVASAVHLFRRKKQNSRIDSKTWQKQVPFKMSFIVWRALRDKIPSGARILRMEFSIYSSCCCCRIPDLETIDHLFCSGAYAQEVWRIICGPRGGEYSIPYVQNQAEMEQHLSIIPYNCLFQEDYHNQAEQSPRTVVKLNSDGSCRNGYCGGGVVVRDSMGCLIYAYILNLGPGTSNWAEAMFLLFGIKWCIKSGFNNILAESNSKLLVDWVNGSNCTPWRVAYQVNELRRLRGHKFLNLNHCFRESNQVADKLASLSHDSLQTQVFLSFVDLPTQVRGIMNMDRWKLPTIRIADKRIAEIPFEPP